MFQSIIALLFVSGEPMSVAQISRLLNVPEEEVANSFEEIKKYLEQGGLSLVMAKDGVSIVTKSEHGDIIDAFRKEELKGDLTPATLQVLTLIAYMNEPSRKDISFIRGVQSAQSIRTLTVRGLIERKGENCCLTTEALRYLGVTSPEELPEYESINKELMQKLKTALSENV